MGLFIGNKELIRDGAVFFVAEIGINHNGDIEIAKRLIDVAVEAGCDAVKFQKRDPDKCVPENQKNVMRETPWGYITYLEYKRKIEFGRNEYDMVDEYCKSKNIMWFASCWDVESVDFISQYDMPVYKIPSACITDLGLLKRISDEHKPVVLSTGMSTQKEVDTAIEQFDPQKLILCHCVSSYPAPVEELNLNVIKTYLQKYPDLIIGYSGHEAIIPTTYVAAALGAVYVERHITLDRAMWGTDQAASVEPHGIKMLTSKIRAIEEAMGDGVKTVTKSEIPVHQKLRKI